MNTANDHPDRAPAASEGRSPIRASRDLGEYPAAIGLVFGGGVGILIGLLGGGTTTVAAWIVVGAALGLVLGAVAGLRRRHDPEVGP